MGIFSRWMLKIQSMLHRLDRWLGLKKDPPVVCSRIHTLPLCPCGESLDVEMERDHGICFNCQKELAERGEVMP